MVKTKQQKSKPKKQPQTKKQGKKADISPFRAQLDSLGLKIIEVTADGNCFFRAIAEQLEGNEEEHVKYRSMVVQYILRNREMFEPFIEDDVPFDDYCRNMEKDSTWAGHMELQAASLVTHSNICIHRYMSARWYIRNFVDRGACMVHLSYHDGEHYNSVRSKEDSNAGPARPIIIKADADISVKSHPQKAVDNKPNGGAGRNIIDAGSIKLVIAGTGCASYEMVEQVLIEVNGDVDAAIEFLISEQGLEEYPEIPPDSPSTSTKYDAIETYDQKFEEAENIKEDVGRSSNNRARDCCSSQPDKISRNQLCPCGSKRKYKACCGTVSGRSSNKVLVNPAVNFRKSRKDKKSGKNGGTIAKVESTHGSDGGPPDMGALCI